jgi:hypothetical protein
MVQSLIGIPEVPVLHINGNSNSLAWHLYLSLSSSRKMYIKYAHFLLHAWRIIRSRPKPSSSDATSIQQLTQIDNDKTNKYQLSKV